MNDSSPSWMKEEEKKARELADKGELPNENAPRFVTVIREPKRKGKNMYMQERYHEAFDDLVYRQRKAKGKSGPELAEEAVRLLCEKYGEEILKP